MTPIPDGHPSIEAVHVPGEGVLHPADPDVAPAAPEVPAVDVAPTEEDGSTNKRRRPRADVAPAAPEVAAVEDPTADEPDGSTKRRRTTRADAEPTEEA